MPSTHHTNDIFKYNQSTLITLVLLFAWNGEYALREKL